MYSQFVIRIRQFMRSTKRTACRVEVRYQPTNVCRLICVFSDVQANIYSLRITTNLLAGSYNNDFTFTFILSSCVYSLKLSSSAIWYMVAYTSNTSHHHQLCSIGTGEAAKATQRTGDTEWYDMVGCDTIPSNATHQCKNVLCLVQTMRLC